MSLYGNSYCRYFYCDIFPWWTLPLPLPSLPPSLLHPSNTKSRANLRKKLDPSYAALLKVRPLDAYSSQRLNDIRSSFVKTEQSISEVNSQLDAQIEKKYEEKKQAGRSVVPWPMVKCNIHVYHSEILSRRKLWIHEFRSLRATLLV